MLANSFGFRNNALIPTPDWSYQLREFYWHVRVNGRDKSLRRRYYRYIKKERLRLVETGLTIELVDSACKYFCTLKPVYAQKFTKALDSYNPQLNLDLF